MKGKWKHICLTICVLILVCIGMLIANVQMTNASSVTTGRDTQVTQYTDATPGIEPTAKPEGYVFAGWYQDEACSQYLKTSGIGYAKFVDENIFQVKAQITASTRAITNKADIRFITTVDSLNYKDVGFVIIINGKTKIVSSDEVYTKLFAVGQTTGDTITYSPTDEFSSKSIYFKTHTIKNVPNLSFGTVITVRARWTTQDGTVVYGNQAKKTINMGVFGMGIVDDGMIFDCDTKDYLIQTGGTTKVTLPNYREGIGAFRSNGSATVWWKIVLENPVDISEYKDGSLKFWLYIDDITHFADTSGKIQIELGSAGVSDQEERQWPYAISDLVSGWNEIVIPFNGVGQANFSSINYMRIYRSLPKDASGVTIAENIEAILDDVCAVSADGTESKSILNCDSTDGVTVSTDNGRSFSVESVYCDVAGTYKEGAGALEVQCAEGKGVLFEFNRGTKIVDVSEKTDGQLHLWFYVNDTDYLNEAKVYLELSSGGKCDVEELQWQLGNLKDGWNEYNLKFSSASKMGVIDFEEIDYLRIFMYGATSSSNLVVRLDDVRACLVGEIFDCDTEKYLQSTDGTADITVDDYKEGSGAVKCKGSEQIWYEFVRTDAVDINTYSSGRLRFWLYVNKVDYLSDSDVIVELSSSATCDSEKIQWNIKPTGLMNGWNEICLPISAPDSRIGSIDLTTVDYLKISQQNSNPNLMTIIDDVCAIENKAQIVDTSNETKDIVIADYIPTEMGYAVDASGATDSTDGIQQALNDCYAAGGGTVYLPSGTYTINQTITIPSYVTLRGDWQDPDSAGFNGQYGTTIHVNMPEVLCEVKEGTGAAKHTTGQNNRFQVNDTWDLTAYKEGSLHLWFYVSDSSKLPNDHIVVALDSNDTNGVFAEDENGWIWKVSTSKLNDGDWTELVLNMSDATHQGASFGWGNVSGIKIHLGNKNTGDVTTIVDDLYVVSGGTESQRLVLNNCDSNIGSGITTLTTVTSEIAKTTSGQNGVFELGGSGGVVGLTVYYPNQNDLTNVKIYPYTFYVDGIGVNHALSTIRNVTVINGYRGIGATTTIPTSTTAEDGTVTVTESMSHESLRIQGLRGTFLECGIELYHSSDVGTVEDVTIKNMYWKQYDAGIDGTILDNYTREHVTGMRLGDVEWTEYANISIDDCNIGIQTVEGRRTSSMAEYTTNNYLQFVGSFYDLRISNCNIGFQANYLDTRWGMTIAKSAITGSTCGIDNNTTALIKLCDVTVTGGVEEATSKTVISDNTDLSSHTLDYTTSYIKPVNRLLIANLSQEKDASVKLQRYLDKMEKMGGGVVYVPGGTYSFYKAITVPAGVELRGSSSVATRDNNSDSEGTLFLCYFGDEGGGIGGTAFITLSGENAGLNGIRIVYANNGPVLTDENTTLNTSFAVRGNAAGVYVVNSMISASAYGVDFRDCDNHYIEGLVTCCYYNTYYLGGKGGTVKDCLQNGTVLVRTKSPVNSETWLKEVDLFSGVFYPILKNYCHYIILEEAIDEVIYNNFAYGVMTMLTNIDSENTKVINIGTDKVGASSAQLIMDGGSLFGVNILRSNTTTAEATDATKDGKYLNKGVASKSYKYIEGDLELHNRLLMKLSSKDQSNEPKVTKETASSIWLFQCDSRDGVNMSELFTVTGDNVKEGSGAYYLKSKNSTRFQAHLASPVDISSKRDGKLHLWFFVNDITYMQKKYSFIGDDSVYVMLGSDATTEECTLTWELPLDTLASGWNELVLDLNKATSSSAGADYYSINYLKIYQTIFDSLSNRNESLITKVDDVRIVSPVEDSNATIKMMLNCDSKTGVVSDGFEIVTGTDEHTEGNGAFKTTGAAVNRVNLCLETPLSISAYENGKLHLDLYINSKANFTDTSGIRVEIGSSRRADCEELQWQIPLDSLQDGWNSITLNISDAAKTGLIHLGAIDHFRMYHTGSSDSLVTILDNIYVTKE